MDNRINKFRKAQCNFFRFVNTKNRNKAFKWAVEYEKLGIKLFGPNTYSMFYEKFYTQSYRAFTGEGQILSNKKFVGLYKYSSRTRFLYILPSIKTRFERTYKIYIKRIA